MAKPITKTTVKYTESHDRIALTIKYVSGEVLKISSTRCAARIAAERPVSLTTPKPTREHMQAILKASDTHVDGENNGERFQRIGKTLESTNSIIEAAVALSA